MPFEVEVQMNGLDELKKKLEGLKYDVAKKGGRFALRKAAQVVQAQVKLNAEEIDRKETPNSIPKNIGISWSGKLNKRTGDLGFRVGVMGGSKQSENAGGITVKGNAPGGSTWYWRFVEFGTEKTAANPFLVPAFKQTLQPATDAFIVNYQKSIDRFLRKQGK